jgi:hypothetical protein
MESRQVIAIADVDEIAAALRGPLLGLLSPGAK